VLGCWVASGLLALTISAHFIRRANLGGWRDPVDWAWVRRGFQVAAIFLVGSLALRALFTVDRFWMEKSASPQVLGAYIFYMSIAGALPALLEAGLFTFEYPSMIATYPDLDIADRRRHARKLLLRAMILSMAYAVMVALCLPLVLGFVGRPEYSEHVFMLAAGMAAMFLYVMGLVPHFALYSMGKDRLIVVGNIVSLLAFFPAVIVLRVVLPVHDTIPAGLCVAFMVLFVWKWVGFSSSSSSISSQVANA
jgi:O-antigen/teichoic acid export membrane protein